MSSWEDHVKWPPCEKCRATGVAVDPKTLWPIECPSCTAARTRAVDRAKAEKRRLVKIGDDL